MSQIIMILLLAIVTGSILYQDLKVRSVTILLFAALAILGAGYNILTTPDISEYFVNSLINFAFLLLQFLLLKLYYFLRSKQDIVLLNKMIGPGDVLFLCGAVLFFNPFNFILFYCSSLLFALLIHFCLLHFTRNKKGYDKTVPLAGLQAFYLFIYMTIDILNA